MLVQSICSYQCISITSNHIRSLQLSIPDTNRNTNNLFNHYHTSGSTDIPSSPVILYLKILCSLTLINKHFSDPNWCLKATCIERLLIDNPKHEYSSQKSSTTDLIHFFYTIHLPIIMAAFNSVGLFLLNHENQKLPPMWFQILVIYEPQKLTNVQCKVWNSFVWRGDKSVYHDKHIISDEYPQGKSSENRITKQIHT